ncbi:MAG TPA: alkaline phosphatase family protein [Gaiellales bacterium]|jgi:phospholipase C|nr:alkaline phosphatase family protein [Gaiellales bacterium]
MAPSEALERLQEVKHLVVLMMENRSFDHMLGYLKLNGVAVDGLTGNETNPDDAGRPVKVFEFPPDFTAFHKLGEPLDESLDPRHDPDDVADQLAGGNQGFLKNFIAKKSPKQHRHLPMGYFTDKHLPVYDYLARTFSVCDAWHSSIPGDTMPNRCYSIAGEQGPSVADKLGIFEDVVGSTVWPQLKDLPIYDLAAFTRQLDDSQWRWYSHDPATLRSVDSRYRKLFDLHKDNFAYFNKKAISLETQAAEVLLVGGSFLDDAANGKLRDVSWIDPNFIDLRTFDSTGDDDHPPSDVHAGQQLVLNLFESLVNSPQWADTVLVITYDEHGGFFDHVIPPNVAAGDGGKYATYGVRVPTLVIGPRVENGVCNTFFDHTSLIATILHRFAKNPDHAIAAMPPRVQSAAHIGSCLLEQPRTDVGPSDLAAPIAELHKKVNAWNLLAEATRHAQPNAPSPAPDGAGHPLIPHDFQADFLKFALTMRRLGLPAGRP